MKNIHIYLSADDNYSPYLGVTLCSIFENKKSTYNINVHIIDGGILDTNKNKLNVLEQKYGFKIEYIKIDLEKFKDFPVRGHMSIATYYRIILAEIVENNIDKIIYLDCDIVVLGDIINLYNIDISDYFLGAVEEEDKDSSLIQQVKKNLSIKENEKYFNAGVLLINVKKWKENNITKKCMDFISNNPQKIIIYDQDGLNYLMHDKCKYIDNTYNVQFKENSTRPIKKPFILHLTSENKPWRYLYINSYGKKQYQYYFKKTPWKDSNLEVINLRLLFKKIIKIIKKNIKIFLKTIGLENFAGHTYSLINKK
jgi:lipopolysaccharide biosynthesis glycosyltransferase